MVEFVVQVAKYQHRRGRLGRHFLIKNPLTSRIWYEPEMANLLALPGVTYMVTWTCVFSVPATQNHTSSCWSLLEPGVLAPIFRRCSNRCLSKILRNMSISTLKDKPKAMVLEYSGCTFLAVSSNVCFLAASFYKLSLSLFFPAVQPLSNPPPNNNNSACHPLPPMKSH